MQVSAGTRLADDARDDMAIERIVAPAAALTVRERTSTCCRAWPPLGSNWRFRRPFAVSAAAGFAVVVDGSNTAAGNPLDIRGYYRRTLGYTLCCSLG